MNKCIPTNTQPRRHAHTVLTSPPHNNSNKARRGFWNRPKIIVDWNIAQEERKATWFEVRDGVIDATAITSASGARVTHHCLVVCRRMYQLFYDLVFVAAAINLGAVITGHAAHARVPSLTVPLFVLVLASTGAYVKSDLNYKGVFVFVTLFILMWYVQHIRQQQLVNSVRSPSHHHH